MLALASRSARARLAEPAVARAEKRHRGRPADTVAGAALGPQLGAEGQELGEVGDDATSPSDAIRTSPCA